MPLKYFSTRGGDERLSFEEVSSRRFLARFDICRQRELDNGTACGQGEAPGRYTKLLGSSTWRLISQHDAGRAGERNLRHASGR